MATETRPGFRLPWAAGTGEAEDPSAMSDPSETEEAEEPDMIETTAMPDSSARPEPTNEPATTAPPARRATKFMADLSRAMQAAAETARGETMARFEVEAKSVVEAIHASATDEAADLRRRADDDVAAIREWSKAEIARIREETDQRITDRKGRLESEIEGHAAVIEREIEAVQGTVARFESEMAAFFERLLGEEDPTRFATMAAATPARSGGSGMRSAMAAMRVGSSSERRRSKKASIWASYSVTVVPTCWTRDSTTRPC